MEKKQFNIILDCLDEDTGRKENTEVQELRELAVEYMERGREEGMLDEKHRILHVLLELEVDPHIIAACTEIPLEQIKEMAINPKDIHDIFA